MLHRRSKKKPEPDDDPAPGELFGPKLTLLILDSETHRFAVLGPVEQFVSRRWVEEIERAARSGRQIFSVSITDGERSEFATLVAGLGYQEWPATTIVSPPADLAADDKSAAARSGDGAAGPSYQLQERELSAISRGGRPRSKSAKPSSGGSKKGK